VGFWKGKLELAAGYAGSERDILNILATVDLMQVDLLPNLVQRRVCSHS